MGSDLLHRFRCSWKPISDINKSPMLQGKFPECWKFHRGDYLNLPLTIAFQAHSDLLLSPGRAASAGAELLWKSLTQMGLVWEQTKFSGLSHKSMMPFPVMLAGATGCPEYRMMEPRLNAPVDTKEACAYCVSTEGSGSVSWSVILWSWKALLLGEEPKVMEIWQLVCQKTGKYFHVEPRSSRISLFQFLTSSIWGTVAQSVFRMSERFFNNEANFVWKKALFKQAGLRCAASPLGSWRCPKMRTPESIGITEIPLATCAHTHKHTN